MGVIMYELVTGRMPFQGENLAKLILAALGSEPMSFQSLGITVPPAFDAIVKRCLRKPREGRFANARELADALAAVMEQPAPRASGWLRFARRSARASGVVRVQRMQTPRSRRTLVGVALLIGLTLAVWSYALAIGPFRASHVPPARTTAISAAPAAPAAKAEAEAPPPPMAAEPTPPSPDPPAPKRAHSPKAAIAPQRPDRKISRFRRSPLTQ